MWRGMLPIEISRQTNGTQASDVHSRKPTLLRLALEIHPRAGKHIPSWISPRSTPHSSRLTVRPAQGYAGPGRPVSQALIARTKVITARYKSAR